MSDDIDELELFLKPTKTKKQILVIVLGVTVVLSMLLSVVLYWNLNYLFVFSLLIAMIYRQSVKIGMHGHCVELNKFLYL